MPVVALTRIALCALMAVLGGCAWESAQVHSLTPAVGTVEASVSIASIEMGHACGRQLQAELEEGVAGEGCERARKAVQRGLARRNGRRARFGWIEGRTVDLRGLHLRVGEAYACKDWPLRRAGENVLWGHQVAGANCRRRPFKGIMLLSGLTHDGRSIPLFERTIRDGVFDLSYARLDRRLKLAGLGGLAAFDRIEFGVAAWAGTLDAVRLRQFQAAWHIRWISQGRGIPGLFVALHPEHSEAGRIRAFAVEGRLVRQELDYQAVARGDLSALDFLERHLWSPYRSPVRSMLFRPRGTDKATVSPGMGIAAGRTP